jgi:6-phosphogluconolactonase
MMINVLPSEQALSVAAADHIVQILREALEHPQRASFVLTGGKTPEKTYQAIAERHADAIDWGRIDFFVGDERFVPPDHDESNFGMAKRALLSRLSASSCETYPYPTTMESPEEAALAYEHTLRAYFGDREPKFDLMLLGLGDDGHVASLFPDSPYLDEVDRWVVNTEAPEGNAVRDRLTMTFPLLNAGTRSVFLVAGADKAEAVRQVRSGENVPGSRIRPGREIIWYLDEAAAAEVESL